MILLKIKSKLKSIYKKLKDVYQSLFYFFVTNEKSVR